MFQVSITIEGARVILASFHTMESAIEYFSIRRLTETINEARISSND